VEAAAEIAGVEEDLGPASTSASPEERLAMSLVESDVQKKYSKAGFLRGLKTVQSVSHLKLQVFSTPLAAPNIQSRQIHHATAKRILVVPGGLTSALHIREHALKKMVTEKVIEGTQIGVGNVIELKDISSNIIEAGNKRNDSIPALWVGTHG
jgi:hypothetical protein